MDERSSTLDYKGLLTLGISLMGVGAAFISIEKMRPTGIAFLTFGFILTMISTKKKEKKGS